MIYKRPVIIVAVPLALFVLSAVLVSPAVLAQGVPDWVRDVALWYGQEKTSEKEFLDAVKFLVDEGIIVLDGEEKPTANIIIPNGNADRIQSGFYLPLDMEVNSGTTVVWVNEDEFPHTIQSIDENGVIIDMFNSLHLNTGDRFSHYFDDEGIYYYYCSLHPWRVGQITVK